MLHLFHIMHDLIFSTTKVVFFLSTKFSTCIEGRGRSQWPRGPGYELSSFARTLGSWVQIQNQGMDIRVRVFCVVLSCVLVAALRRADPPSKESYRMCIGLRN
jgi:hypothetical protein